MKGSTLAHGAEARAGAPAGARRTRGAHPGRSARGLSHDAPVAEDRRQGDPAQEPEPGVLPDQRRRTRSDARRGRRCTCAAGYDWFFPYYRDRALCLALGVTPLEMLLASVGSKDDPASGGRQMPSHWGHRRLNIPSQSSATGTQCLHAVGCAEAGVIYERVATFPIASRGSTRDEVTYVSIGDGATSEGEFWESLNTACTSKLPILYLVEDNGYAISVPVEVQTPGGDISRLVEHFPGLRVFRCDGTDYLASYRDAGRGGRARARAARARRSSTRRSSARTRTRSRTTRSCTRRRPSARPRRGAIRCCGCASFLKTEGLATDDELADILASVEREVNAAADAGARGAEARARDRHALRVLAGRRSDVAAFRDRAAARGHAGHDGGRDQRDAAATRWRATRASSSSARTSPTRAARRRCRRVAGKGGVFKVTHGLQRRLRQRPRLQLAAGRGQHHRARASAWRCAASSRWSRSSSSTTSGRRFMQIRDEMSMMRYRSSNNWSCPMVDPRADRRLPARRRAVPQPVGRRDLRAHARHPHRVPVERAGRGRPAAHGDPLRRPGAVPRAQAPLPPDLQQGAVPGQRLHDAVRQGRGRARRHRRRGLHVGRAGAAVAAGGAAGRARRHQRRGHRSAHDHSVRLGDDRRLHAARRAASSSCTRIS